MFGTRKKKPEEVFVPRSAEVDLKSYIPRNDLEKELFRAVNGSKNILLQGESGCGKTWLYKKVFAEQGINFEPIIDLAEAAKDGMTIEKVIEQTLDFGKAYIKECYKETKSAEVSAVGVAKGGLTTENGFTIRENPVERIYEKLSAKKTSVLVLDNIEHISHSSERLIELNSLLMKIDNKNFAQYNVKILVVGTPNGVKQFYNNIDNLDTISNRLEEISEVKGLEKGTPIKNIFQKTMLDQLKYTFEDIDKRKFCNYIFEITGGIPQRLHEYCLRLCYAIEDSNGDTNFRVHKLADREYVRKSYSKYVTVIRKAMNSYETDIQRRNQVLFSLGKVKSQAFSSEDIKAIVKKQFKYEDSENIQITQSLNDLVTGDNSILTKVGDKWMFKDIQYAFVIRLILEKNSKTKKITLKNNI